jgi:hypothetical protein
MQYNFLNFVTSIVFKSRHLSRIHCSKQVISQEYHFQNRMLVKHVLFNTGHWSNLRCSKQYTDQSYLVQNITPVKRILFKMINHLVKLIYFHLHVKGKDGVWDEQLFRVAGPVKQTRALFNLSWIARRWEGTRSEAILNDTGYHHQNSFKCQLNHLAACKI